MRVSLFMLALLFSSSNYAQVLSNQEQSKVDNTLRAIKSEHQFDTTGKRPAGAGVKVAINPAIIDATGLPIVIIDGVINEFDAFKQTDRNKIESVVVLKKESIQALFCNATSRDVIIVTLKKNTSAPI